MLRSKKLYFLFRLQEHWMTGTVFILYLATNELLETITTILSVYFTQIFGYYGFGSSSQKLCRFLGAMADLSGFVSWFTIGMIAVTRAVGLTHKKLWKKFCTKTNLGLMFIVPWIWSVMLSLPTFVDPSVEYGFNCQMGTCDRLSTGQMNLVPQVILQVTTKMLKVSVGRVQKLLTKQLILQIFPQAPGFIAPLIMIVFSYMVIWLQLRTSFSYERKHM